MSKTVSKLDETVQDLITSAAEVGVHFNPQLPGSIFAGDAAGNFLST
jgi:hypothetical protein